MTSEEAIREKFPLLRTKDSLLEEIYTSPHLLRMFQSWQEDKKQEFIDMCTGAKGVKILYDSVFKEIMNPEYTPERIGDFLSVLLKQRVVVLHALPNDSVRIGAENSLLYTDLVVQLEDGSLANIEIQKIGYLFPGQRSACYSADLLLRQYKRVREEIKNIPNKKFSYKDIMPVYTIVIFEKSPNVFHAFPSDYLHYIEAKSNTGIELELLQKYLFISLDIFKENVQNKGSIDNRIEAWLSFLSMDEPVNILNLIEVYPEFQRMYDEVYQLCLNTEKVMEMFSEELRILDHNTAEYMVDVMQDEIDALKDKTQKQQDTIDVQQNTIDMQQSTIGSQQSTIDSQQKEISDLKRKLLKMQG